MNLPMRAAACGSTMEAKTGPPCWRSSRNRGGPPSLFVFCRRGGAPLYFFQELHQRSFLDLLQGGGGLFHCDSLLIALLYNNVIV